LACASSTASAGMSSGLDPELVLPGVAAGGIPLIGRREPGGGQPDLLSVHGCGAGDFDAEVVEGQPGPGFSIRTSLSGASAIAKFRQLCTSTASLPSQAHAGPWPCSADAAALTGAGGRALAIGEGV
jgi:hypothetical protein